MRSFTIFAAVVRTYLAKRGKNQPDLLLALRAR